jgi:hypothetical protein
MGITLNIKKGFQKKLAPKAVNMKIRPELFHSFPTTTYSSNLKVKTASSSETMFTHLPSYNALHPTTP